MMDCKTALNENNGDIDAAIDWLRAKGLSKAAKKADRVASEGLVALSVDGGKGVVVEVNSETDFVARNETFQQTVAQIADVALSVDGDLEALKGADFPGAGKSVDEHLTELVGTIGENMTLRRSSGVSVGEGVVASYVHNQTVEGAGKIGVLVGLESSGDAAKLQALGKQVCMHVAATNPLSLSSEDLDPQIVERERTVLIDQAKESGKPQEIAEKMVEGRIQKFYKEVALLSQTFVIDGENTVEQAIKNAEGDIGAPVKVTGFIRLELGEGVEKKEENFAEEVAAAAGN